MNKILISVIITNYNYDKYLESSILSVINQSLGKEEYEVIIIDDGSSDSSPQILKKYENTHNFKIIFQNNSGQAAAINTGIKNAQGEILSFLDSDDCFEKNKLELIKSEFEKNKNLKIIKHKVSLTDPYGKTIFHDFPLYTTSTMSIRSEVISQFGYVPERLKISADTFFYMLECFAEWKMISLPLAKYRIHFNNYFGTKFSELVKKDLPIYYLIKDNLLITLGSSVVNQNRLLQSRILEYEIYSDIFLKNRLSALKKFRRFNKLHELEPYLLFKNALIFLGILSPFFLNLIRDLDFNHPKLSGYLRKVRGKLLPKKWENS